MSTFNPCKGKTACRDDGKQCLTCGRSFTEIEQTGNLIDAPAEFVCVQGFDNINEFAVYVADRWRRRSSIGARQKYCLMVEPAAQFKRFYFLVFNAIYIQKNMAKILSRISSTLPTPGILAYFGA